jgi:ABC-type transporter Mla MlaB component
MGRTRESNSWEPDKVILDPALRRHQTRSVAFRHSAALAVPVRPGEHACCHFADAADRERLAVAFVRDGLGRGDKVVYFFDGDATGLVARLERLDPGFDAAMARGQFEVRRARDTYIPDGRFEADRMLAVLREEHERARAEGYSGLSVTGEVPDAVCKLPGGEQLGVYETRIASDVDAPRSSVLCQYDHGRFGPDVLSDVVEAHEVEASPELAVIGRDGELAAAHDHGHDALRLAGELDFGCAQTVSEVLGAQFPGPLRLDLADLSYVDVAGMRALRGRKGQRLIISPASDAVRRLLALLAWDTDPEVELLEGGSAHAPQPLGL